MAGSFNRITILGNLTKDPESKNIPSGSMVCNFTVAVNRPPSKNESAQNVDYFRVNAWDKLAETCQKYLKKGMPVLIDGKMQIRPYTDKDGNKRESAEIVANTMQMLSTKNPGESAMEHDDSGNHDGEPVGVASHATASAIDEEIPF